jgi:hypothetical protein
MLQSMVFLIEIVWGEENYLIVIFLGAAPFGGSIMLVSAAAYFGTKVDNGCWLPTTLWFLRRRLGEPDNCTRAWFLMLSRLLMNDYGGCC